MSEEYVNYKTACLFSLLILFTTGNSHAQSVSTATVNSTGNTYNHTGITYEWSVGEMAIVETMINIKAGITNGLLQPVRAPRTVTDTITVLATNILTPNGDGKNDTWIIEDIEKFSDNEVTVFDRLGRIVFQTKNYKNDWNGTFSGLPLKEDTYYYILRLKKGDNFITRKGYITILN